MTYLMYINDSINLLVLSAFKLTVHVSLQSTVSSVDE